MDWYQVKLAAIEATGLGRDALHILIGIGGQFLAALVLRRSLASPLPWACVLVAQSLNELFDLNYEQWTDRPMWPESLHDMWVTMLVPTLLLVVARYAPRLLVPARAAASEIEASDEDGESTPAAS